MTSHWNEGAKLRPLFVAAPRVPGWFGGVWGLGEPAVSSVPRDF